MDTRRLRLHAFTNSLANNVASPFVTFNATMSGESDILIGYIQAIGPLGSATTQLVGGRLVDRFGRRLQVSMVLSAIVGLIWFFPAGFPSTTSLFLSYTAVTLAIGFYAAGWSAFIGETSEIDGRGAFLAGFTRLASLGALVALVLTTLITRISPSFTVLFYISGLLFVVSSLILKGQKEPHIGRVTTTVDQWRRLRRYYGVTAFYGLFWGFAWPLFTITTVKIVKMNLVEFSFSQLVAIASTIAFQPIVGRMVDRNRRRSVFVGRLGLIVFPLALIFTTSPWEIYLLNMYSGFTNAMLNVAFSAYLFDLSPAGGRGRTSSEFSFVQGVATMLGSLSGGYLLSALTYSNGLWLSLAYLYVVSAVGRGAAAFLHLKLEIPTPVGRTVPRTPMPGS